jgi:hypothetical protein
MNKQQLHPDMTTRIFILALVIPIMAFAAPPAGYNLVFNGNFKGHGGNADGWLPISEWGPLQTYVLGNELWYPEFIDHTPDGRDFGYATFSPSIASQGYGKMTWTPYNTQPDYKGTWYGGLLSTVDTNAHGFQVTPPFYATVLMSLPASGRDVWPAFWMTTVNRILPRPQTTNSAEIDVIEMYGNAPYTQEIHTAVRDPNGNQLGGAADFAYNPGALSQYGQFYSVWVDSANGVIRFFVESATWDGKPAGDYHEVFSCAYLPDGMNQPWYLLVDYAMQDRSWTGKPYTLPSSMAVWQFQCYKP